MKKFLFILLLTVTPIIKPIYNVMINFYFSAVPTVVYNRLDFAFKMNECKIENYKKLLNAKLQEDRVFKYDQQFNFFAINSISNYQEHYRDNTNESKITTDQELQDYAQTKHDHYNLFIIAIEKTKDEEKKEQEEEEQKRKKEYAAVDKLIADNSQSCIIQ